MVYIEMNLFALICLLIVITLPSLAFCIALLLAEIREWKAKKKWVKKILTEDKGEKLKL